MARQSPVESKSPSSAVAPKPDNVLLAKPLPSQPIGIIILPSSCQQQDDDDSPLSSTSDSRVNSSSSLPDLPGAERTLNRRATTSTTALNVKFAPLPQLAPRKRRYNAPMGIASRAVIMRRRRAGTPGYDMNGDPLPPPPPPPMWTEEEIQRQTQRMLAERNGQSPSREGDDPFASLGKMVKGVWRKVNKKPGEKEEKSGEANGGPPNGVVVAERVVLAPISGDNTSLQEQGGVWEEEVGDRFPLNVGQTETIVEGQYSWSAAHLKPALEDNGSVSDDASAREHNLSSTEGTEEESTTHESHHPYVS